MEFRPTAHALTAQVVTPPMKYSCTILVLASFLTLCAGPVLASDTTDLLDTAVHAIQTGSPDSAAVILYALTEEIEDKPERVRAMFYLAQALGQLGRTEESIQYYTRAAEVDSTAPFSDDVLLAHARALLHAGNSNGSISLAQNFMRSFPASPLLPEVLYLTGEAHLGAGEYLKAFNTFSEITRNGSDALIVREASVQEGVCLYHLQLISGAVDRLEKYLADSPRGPSLDRALHYLGLSYEALGKPERAAQSFRRLTLEYPAYPEILEAYFRLGKNLFETARFAEAENAFENFVENSRPDAPRYDEALFFIERIAFRQGRYESETDIAENFIAKYPSSRLVPKLLLDLGRYYRLSEEPERAVNKYQTVLSLHPRSDLADSALFYAADTYLAIDRPDRAVAYLSEMTHRRRNPVRAQASYLKLGMIGEELGRHDEAIAWYDSAAALGASPDLTVRALMGVARSYRDVNRWLDASKTYERILRIWPNTIHRADVHYSLAGVYYLMGRLLDSIQTARDGLKIAKGRRKTDILVFLADVYETVDIDQAFRCYSEIWSDTGNSPETRAEALLKLGDISVSRGDRKSAAEAYARLIKGGPDSPYREKAIQKLDELNGDADVPDTSKSQ